VRLWVPHLAIDGDVIRGEKEGRANVGKGRRMGVVRGVGVGFLNVVNFGALNKRVPAVRRGVKGTGG